MELVKTYEQKGGLLHIAEMAGFKGAEALDQVIKEVKLPPKLDGSRSVRSLGDPAARAIEQAFGLGVGWFDSDDRPDLWPFSRELLAAARAADPAQLRQAENAARACLDLDALPRVANEMAA